MIAALRSLRTYFTRIGAALPAAIATKHGQLNIKQASATEDEAWLVLRDASGALQYRRILTKTYGDTLYADIASEHDAVTVLDGSGVDFTLVGQQITAEPIFLGTGVAGTVARSDHNHDADYADIASEHDAATVADTASIDMTLTGQQISAAAIFGSTATTVAAGDHNHDADYVNVTGDTMTGKLTLQLDDDKLLIIDADETRRLLASAFSLKFLNGFDVLMYSDDGVTLKAVIDGVTGNIQTAGNVEINGALNHDGSTAGFYGTTPTAQQTGVAVTAAGIHAALVNLGLITA